MAPRFQVSPVNYGNSSLAAWLASTTGILCRGGQQLAVGRQLWLSAWRSIAQNLLAEEGGGNHSEMRKQSDVRTRVCTPLWLHASAPNRPNKINNKPLQTTTALVRIAMLILI